MHGHGMGMGCGGVTRLRRAEVDRLRAFLRRDRRRGRRLGDPDPRLCGGNVGCEMWECGNVGNADPRLDGLLRVLLRLVATDAGEAVPVVQDEGRRGG